MRAITFVILFIQLFSPYRQVLGIQSHVEKGFLNLSSSNFEDDNIVSLNGEWTFYEGQQLTPSDFTENLLARSTFLNIPGIWNNHDISPEGVGTYRLRLKLPAQKQSLALYVPNTYSAYNLYVDEELVSSNGVVSSSAVDAMAGWKINVVYLEGINEYVDLTWQVSNYHHFRGGIHKPILIGSFKSVLDYKELLTIGDMLLLGGLLVMGASALIFFAFRSTLRQYLYFGLVCLFWAIRSIFSHIYIVNHLWPEMPWENSIGIEYASFYLSFLFGMLFLHKVFKESSGLSTPIFSIINGLFVISVVILKPIQFTALLNAFFIFMGISLIFVFYYIIKSIIAKRFEGWISLIGISIALFVFIAEFLAYNFEIPLNYVLLNLAYLGIFFINSLVLVHDYVKAHKRNDQLEFEKSAMYGRTRI